MPYGSDGRPGRTRLYLSCLILTGVAGSQTVYIYCKLSTLSFPEFYSPHLQNSIAVSARTPQAMATHDANASEIRQPKPGSFSLYGRRVYVESRRPINTTYDYTKLEEAARKKTESYHGALWLIDSRLRRAGMLTCPLNRGLHVHVG